VGSLVRVIAEVKRSSPSKGEINPNLDVGEQCRAYATGGAAAISVLTEPTRFSGELEDLRQARAVCALPLLRKDFIIDRLQLLEARAAGASGVLLIVRALAPSRLEDLFGDAIELELEPLVEVRNEAELERALAAGATIIGVNNRDLETLEMDDAAARVIPRIPRSCVAVAESGYRTADDIARIAGFGADAVLIGSELSRVTEPASALAQFTTIPSAADARPN
jgi:indole-3-glycerol phosphate synthase